MDNSEFYSNVEENRYDQKVKLIEKGRQLHNQAIQEVLIILVRRVTHLLRNCFGGRSRNQEVAYFSGGITAKKQVS